ncbi:MAG: hypothetical protein QM658_04130 [Gordonia sp. (in: high G+C Gram-positive bacteria)]
MGDNHAYRQLPRLVEGTPVLARPDHRLHVGCDPGDALTLPLPPEADAVAVARLLDDLRFPHTYAQIATRVRAAGVSRECFRGLLAALVAAGRAVDTASPPSLLRIRVVGEGLLARLIATGLHRSGHDVATGRIPLGELDCQLLIAADGLVVDPAVQAALMAERTPHLPIVVRDGVGAIGPLVLPGLTSCLRCVDERRCDADPLWPVLAAGLHRRHDDATGSMIAATAALALQEVGDLAGRLATPAAEPPRLVGHVLELRASPARTLWSAVPPHPRCGCVAPTAA